MSEWNSSDWIGAWGSNLPMVVDTEGWGLPELPAGYEWLITRDITAGRDTFHPTYRVALLHVGSEEEDFETLDHGLIDKQMYGEIGVRQRAQRMWEKFNADRS